MTSENDLEVKVAKLETKMDTIIDTVALINRKFDELMEDRVTRRELDEFKAEVKRSMLARTLLTTALTCIITALISYVIADFLN